MPFYKLHSVLLDLWKYFPSPKHGMQKYVYALWPYMATCTFLFLLEMSLGFYIAPKSVHTNSSQKKKSWVQL